MLEELHRTLVAQGGRAVAERAEIAAAPGARIHFSRIEPILARLEFPDHRFTPTPLAGRRREPAGQAPTNYAARGR